MVLRQDTAPCIVLSGGLSNRERISKKNEVKAPARTFVLRSLVSETELIGHKLEVAVLRIAPASQ